MPTLNTSFGVKLETSTEIEAATFMGLFSRKEAPATRAAASGASADRAREMFIERNGLPPSPKDQMQVVANHLGVTVNDLDHVLTITKIYGVFQVLAGQLSSNVGESGIPEEIDRVIESVGYDDDVLWNVIFARGTTGVALAEIITQEWLNTGQLAEVVADQVRDEGGVTLTVQLTDPGLELTEPQQVAYQGMRDLALYHVVYGPGDEQQLADALVDVLPELMVATGGLWLGGTGELARWMMWSGEHGSAMVLLPDLRTNDDNLVYLDLVDKLDTLPAPWVAKPGHQGAFVPKECAAIIESSQLVETAALDAMATEPTKSVRRELRRSLQEGGVEQTSPVMFKGVFAGVGERTQLLWLHLGTELQLLSPILESDGVPAHFEGHDFGRYTLEMVGSMVVLKLSLDYSIGVDRIKEEAVVLARYADECELTQTGSEGDDRF